MTDKIPLLDRTTPLAWRYEKGNKAFVHKSRLKEGGRAYYGLGYTETPLYAADPDLARKAASADMLAEALEPVMHWYQSDEHEPRELTDIVADIVSDLQQDRKAALHFEALKRSGNKLSFAAQTSCGTAGRDEGLVAAIDAWEQALTEHRSQS